MMPAEDHESPEQLNERLQSNYNELAEMAGSLAHEIKNPLSVIRMNMDLLGEDFAEPQTQRERRAVSFCGVGLLRRRAQPTLSSSSSSAGLRSCAFRVPIRRPVRLTVTTRGAGRSLFRNSES